jgi:MFS family permease
MRRPLSTRSTGQVGGDPVTGWLAMVQPLHRRVLAGLGAAQIIGGAGMAAAVVAGGLLGHQLLRSDSLAGLPMALALAGTTAAAIPLARHMRRAGRRAGLATAWLIASAGAAMVAVAAVAELPLLFLAGMLLFGWSSTAGDSARFAAADLALPRSRGTSIGVILAAAAVSGVIGPMLVEPAAAAARWAHLPDLAGPFALSAVTFGAAAAVLSLLLQPDPLLTLQAARRQDAPPTAQRTDAQPAVGLVDVPPAGGLIGDRASRTGRTARMAWMAPLRQPGAKLAVVSASIANLVMVAVMTVTPLHLVAHGHHLGAVGMLLSLHIVGMFAPSPLSGWLCDRLGSRVVITGGGSVLAAAGVVAATSGPGDQLIAMFLLGAGWNLAHVGSSTLLVESTSPDSRVSAQGLTDTSRGLAAMIGAAASGPVLATGGFPAVASFAALASAALLIVVVTTRRARTPASR